MIAALRCADRATRGLVRAPVLVLSWWVGAVPVLAVGSSLVRRSLEGGVPSEAGDLLTLALWSFAAVLAWAWYLLCHVFLLQQAGSSLAGRPIPRLPTPRRVLDQLPALTRAHGARLLVSLLALIPLGAALPLARLVTGSWPVRAVLGPVPGRRPWLPPLEVVVVQLAAWVLAALLALNVAVLLAWMAHGSLLDAAALLPRLTDARLWVAALLVALSIAEPWRILAVAAALGFPEPGQASAVESGGAPLS